VENLSATPGLAEGGACAKAVAGLLLPALADLVSVSHYYEHLNTIVTIFDISGCHSGLKIYQVTVEQHSSVCRCDKEGSKILNPHLIVI